MEHRPNDVRDEDSMSRDDPSEDALYGQKFARVVSKYKTRAGVMYFKIREVRRWTASDVQMMLLFRARYNHLGKLRIQHSPSHPH